MRPHREAQQRHVLARHSQVGATDLPVGHQLCGHEFGRVDPHRETDALRREDDRGVHSDDLAPAVRERATRVARVERRVGLDHVVDQAAGHRAQRTPQRAHDTRRNAALKAQRVADRDHQLTHAQRFGVSERSNLERSIPCTRRHAQHRQIRRRILADQRGVEPSSVGYHHVHARRLVHHVAVRQHEPIRGEHEARPLAGPLGRPTPASTIPRATASWPDRLSHVDLDYGGAHALRGVDHGLGVGVEQILILCRRHAMVTALGSGGGVPRCRSW